MKGRNAQVSRILAILDILENAPFALSVGEIHSRITDRDHDASKRTVYRDIEALAKAGFPLFPDTGEDGEDKKNPKWRINKGSRIHQHLPLNSKELFTLILARGALKPLQGTPFYEDLQGIFKKLESRLGKMQLKYLEELKSEIRFPEDPAWALGIQPEIMETLRSACAEGQVLECVYYSVNSRGESKRKLGPHYLYYAQGGLYLVAEDLKDKKVKVFAVPRFKNAEMMDEEYKGAVSSPEALFAGGMAIYNGVKPENITIEFESTVAHFVKERRWHSTQRITALEKGRISVSLKLGQTPELHAWILGFGPNARVIAPESLKRAIRKQAHGTAALYVES
jgi:predicted DNA-binding transcriptional regulator YafY